MRSGVAEAGHLLADRPNTQGRRSGPTSDRSAQSNLLDCPGAAERNTEEEERREEGREPSSQFRTWVAFLAYDDDGSSFVCNMSC